MTPCLHSIGPRGRRSRWTRQPTGRNYLLLAAILLHQFRSSGNEAGASLLEHELRQMAVATGGHRTSTNWASFNIKVHGLFRTDPVDLSDERLMELTVRGDERAFTVLYDRYQRKLLSYFHRMLWNDWERAEDFLQDLFTKIAQKLDSYNPERPFRTWPYSVARTTCARTNTAGWPHARRPFRN